MTANAPSGPEIVPPHRRAEMLAPIEGYGLTGQRRDGGKLPLQAAWRFICLAEIANFDALRRRLGCIRADRLVIDVAALVTPVLPAARLALIGRHLIEIAFEGADRSVLRDALAELGSVFDGVIAVDKESHRLDLHFGASAAPAVGCDDVRLVEEAEVALALASADTPVIIRDLTELTPAIDRTSLSVELPAALAAGQLFLQYQPKVHLRRQEIASVEALIRWDHPERGLILPSDFIPAAEETRHIAPLTLWTLRQAIADQRTLAAGGHDIPVFLNIAGTLLANQPFVAAACELVRAGGAKIGFEITETSVIRDPDRAIANLHVFAEIGITIAIDDYGAGLSSLVYLKRLPASELKIDKLFVTQLTSSHRDPLIVRSTIDLAHALEMEVTAEGIENPATLALLSVMGCDMAQGYLISRPIGLSALLRFLDEDAHLQATDAAQSPFGNLAAVWKRG